MAADEKAPRLAQPGRGWPRGAARGVWVALLSAALAGCALLLLSFAYGRDQAIYAVVARTILDGGLPYRDAWDFKPPGIYLIYAAAQALFGAAPWAIRALEAASLAITSWAMTRLAHRWWGEPLIGLLGAALAALVHLQLDFWHSAQPETFGGTLTMLAMLLCADSRARRARGRWLGAGVLFGLAGLLKPPLAGGALALVLWMSWPTRHAEGPAAARGRAATAGRLAVWVTLGGALPLALCALWLWRGGALPAVREIFVDFTPHYTRLGWQGHGAAALLWHAAREWLLGYGGALSVGLLLAAARWRATLRRRGVELLLGIVAVNLLGVALQAKFFPYHYAACWPATGMLAALGWWQAGLWLRRRMRMALPLLVGAGVLAAVARTATRDLPGSFWQRAAQRARLLATGLQDQAALDALATVADIDAATNRELAALLRERVPPGGRVFVWGFEPVLYALSGRHAASRFIYNVPQRVGWFSAAARRELMGELTVHPPVAIVVAEHDPLPMVTGDLVDSRQALDSFVELEHLIAARYRPVARIGDLQLYLERPDATAYALPLDDSAARSSTIRRALLLAGAGLDGRGRSGLGAAHRGGLGPLALRQAQRDAHRRRLVGVGEKRAAAREALAWPGVTPAAAGGEQHGPEQAGASGGAQS